jgi:hypothetical protein
MEVTVEVFDNFEEHPVDWVFRVNGDGYIDVVIEEKVMDTLYELGEITDIAELIDCVHQLMAFWKLQWQNIIV